MIYVDETDPVGEIEPSFGFRHVTTRRNCTLDDDYILGDEIGRGKFGRVHKCETPSHLQLAVKIVTTRRKEEKRNVQREIEIMNRLHHPRLIQLFDAIEDVSRAEMCLVIERIEGGELFDRIIKDDEFLLTEKACSIFIRQICEGIEFIHSKNVIHLDMKPENVLCLSKSGNRIKIIDFGLARIYDPSRKLQVLFGTPEFVAPEVVNFEEIDYATDMWSVGVITYVLLSGLSPFMGDNDAETMANVTIAKYDFDDECFETISNDAIDFITKLLKKDKRERLSASECLREPWLAKKTPKPPAPPREEELTKDHLREFCERWNEKEFLFTSPAPFLSKLSGESAGVVDLVSSIRRFSYQLHDDLSTSLRKCSWGDVSVNVQ